MSKQNPNQDYYKTAGRGQSEGPDRIEATFEDDKHALAESERRQTRSMHPAVQRSKKK